MVNDNLYSFGYRHTNSSGVMVMQFNNRELIQYMWIIV